MRLFHRLLHYSLTVALGVAILALLLWPSAPAATPTFFNDKVVHVALFAALGLVFWSEYALRHPRSSAWRALLLLTPCLVSFAAVSELLQAYLPLFQRSGDWSDFVADCVGIALATPLGLLLLAWRKAQVHR